MRIKLQGPRGVKKLVTNAIREDSGKRGPTIAEQVRALRVDGKADEAASLVVRATGMNDDEANKFIDALD